jgi:hypothetical protein
VLERLRSQKREPLVTTRNSDDFKYAASTACQSWPQGSSQRSEERPFEGRIRVARTSWNAAEKGETANVNRTSSRIRKAPMTAQIPLPAEMQEQIFGALGHAVAKVWDQLPQNIQHQVFEEAAGSQGESARHHLAVFLHYKHQRTSDTIKAQALPEPDSLGG